MDEIPQLPELPPLIEVTVFDRLCGECGDLDCARHQGGSWVSNPAAAPEIFFDFTGSNR